MGTPAAEVAIDERLVRSLLADQHPDLADLPVELAAQGWDNELWRLGPVLAVRLPRRTLAARLIEHEQRWLPELASHLPLPVPAPVRVGRPALDYPWAWSVVPWLPGRPAWRDPPSDPLDAAERLGGFLAALHRPAPADAPANPYRGIPLAARRARFDEALAAADGRDPAWATRSGTAAAAVVRRWDRLAAAPAWAGPPLWLHGDLHPLNVLVAGGRLSAVVDFGDLTSGDPATDLAVAWMLLPVHARPAFRTAAGARDTGPVDDATWQRAAAWALALALAYLEDDGEVRDMGFHTIGEVMADPQFA